MARIVLHIGLHKTGTTTVQDVLCCSQKTLQRHGLIYPEPTYGTAHHDFLFGKGTNPPLLPLAYRADCGADKLWKKLIDDHANSDRTVLLSSELFGAAYEDPVERFAWIAQKLEAFDEKQIVCVLRDQLSLVQSAYLQAAKIRETDSPGQAVEHAVTLGKVENTHLCFGQLYAAIRQSFAAQEIRMLDYACLLRQSNGVLNAVLRAARPHLSAESLHLESDGWSNRTPEPLALIAARMIAPQHRLPEKLVELAAKVLAQQFGERSSTTIFTRLEVARLIKQFRAENQQLNELLIRDGYSLPLELPDWSERIHREDLNAGFWLSMAREMAV